MDVQVAISPELAVKLAGFAKPWNWNDNSCAAAEARHQLPSKSFVI